MIARRIAAVLGFVVLFVLAPVYAAPLVDAAPVLVAPWFPPVGLAAAVLVALKADRRLLRLVRRAA